MSELIVRQMLLVRQAYARILRYLDDHQEGQGLVEYALIIMFISILVIIVTRLMVPALTTSFNNVANSL
jgi:Flp pilus assembly pilin Flp